MPKRKEAKTIYLRASARRRPVGTRGMVLAHNHVRHDEHTPIGWNGFRAFFCYRAGLPSFVVCPCDWRPELGKHYASKKHVQHYDTPKKRAAIFRKYARTNPTVKDGEVVWPCGSAS
jgi:hypothetical protein